MGFYRKKIAGEYLNGKKHGKWSYMYYNGNKHSEGEYQYNKKTGIWTYWYESGKKEAEKEHCNGKQARKFTCWDEKGKIREIGEIIHNTFEGIPYNIYKRTRYYDYSKGKKDAQTFFRDGGKKYNTWTYWYESGRKRREMHFDFDGQKCGSWIKWHRNGKKSEEVEVKDEYVYRWKQWDEKGKVIKDDIEPEGLLYDYW